MRCSHTQVKSFFRMLCMGAGLLAILAQAPVFGGECCTRTANAASKFGVAEAMADYWQSFGGCLNMPNGERAQCREDVQTALLDALDEVEEQNIERLKICRQLGERCYSPVIEPNQFVDFDAVLAGEEVFTPNQYFPLTPGTVWEYIGFDEEGEEAETIRVEVLNETREILGIQCIVVRDQVWEIEDVNDVDDAFLVEDTEDYFAQDLEGTVWYMGEISQNFEDGELDSLDGSWQAGQDGAHPGVIMFADPNTNGVYRQEFFVGEAEDVARVVSRDESVVTVPFGTFDDDVLRIREWSPLEPGTVEFKFYAPGVGTLLETDPDTGEEVVLVDMTMG